MNWRRSHRAREEVIRGAPAADTGAGRGRRTEDGGPRRRHGSRGAADLRVAAKGSFPQRVSQLANTKKH